MNIIRYFILLFIIILLHNCTLFQKNIKIKPLNFQYNLITNYYFNSNSDKPFPLTVQRGSNLHPSTTKDGRFLFFATNKEGNYDIWFRDLTSSIVIPVTNHPSAEYKPAISPDGKLLAYVSEEFDSEGDIVLLPIEPEEWVENHLRGRENSIEEPLYITNLKRKKLSDLDRNKDIDPCFSPDGKFLVFASDRFSPGLMNLVIYELSSGKLLPLTSNGGTSPSFSDGLHLVYLSFKDDPKGEIYRINLLTKEETRLTNDKFLDFSPSMDEKNRYLFYTSIRKDTNQNGELDLKDASVIVKKDMETGKEVYLTPSNASVFDSKYTNFNGGSILYSQAVYNAINVYFIPTYGPIPRQSSIREQFEKVKLLSGKVSRDWFLLGLDSIRNFFEDDPKYPVFKVKTFELNLEDLQKRKRIEELLNLIQLQSESSTYAEGDYYKKAILMKWDAKLHKKQILFTYFKLDRELLEKHPEHKEEHSAIQEMIGEEQEQSKNFNEALKTYSSILKENPTFHNRDKIIRKIAEISYRNDHTEVPTEIVTLLEDKEALIEDKRDLLNFLEDKIKKNRTNSQIKIKVDELKSGNVGRSTYLNDLLGYVYAKVLYEEKKFKESNQLLDSFLKPLPPRDDLCWSKEDCVPVQICANDPTCLKGHLLKSKNFESQGSVMESLNELRVYLENYDPRLGVDMDQTEMERSFRYFENRARELYNEGSLKDAATNYFYNTENMFHMKNKNLHVDTLYRKYGVYYYKKMVDTSLDLAVRQAEQARVSLFKKLNILGKDKLDVMGRVNTALDIFLDNKVTKNLKLLGDLRDLESQIVLGDPDNKDDGLRLMDMHFNLARPRARPSLYLAALYGYAYYLINRSVIKEEFYRKNQTMTVVRKEKALEDFKTAEYELKWILFADPQYSDAYQLLGWLYQYIDITRSLKAQDATSTEGETYAESYNKFFSSKHIEENIDLYEQILTFLGDISNKKVLSDLNLNLGNNYLLLNNYPKANQHFSEVYNYRKFINPEIQFENYTQISLFEYNYARTLIYQGKFEEAVGHFKKALEIVEKNDYVRKGNYAKNNSEENKQKYSPQYKMIILNALIGLSYMESGDYKSAIFHIKRTIALNRDFPFLDLTHLYNALAICYLKIDDTKLSLYFVKNAKRAYFQSESEFHLPSVGSWFWNIILPENIRIIGDGRFPGSFPKEYSYLLSLGIEAGIYEKQNDTKKLSNIYSIREKFIKKEGFSKSTVGRTIHILDKANYGYTEFQKSNYSQSAELYKDIYKNSLASQVRWTYLRRAGIAFIWDEKVKEPQLVRKEIDEFVKFKKNMVQACLPDENAGPISETERTNCELDFQKKHIWYNPLLSMLFLKLANLYKYTNINIYYNNLGISLDKIQKAGDIPEDLQFLQSDPFSRIERLHLKLLEARILLDLNEKEKFTKLIKEIYMFSKEFKAQKEEFMTRVLEGEFLGKNANSKKDLIQLSKFHESTLNLLFSDPYLIYSLPLEFIKSQLNQTEIIYTKLSLDENSLFLRERYQATILFKNIISNLINFEDEELGKDFAALKKDINEYVKLNKLITSEFEKRKPILTLWERKNKNYKTLNSKIVEFKQKYPKRASFFEWQKDGTKLQNQKSIPIFRLHQNLSGEIFLWKYFSNKTKQIKAKEISDFFQAENFWDNLESSEIQVILDPEMDEKILSDFLERIKDRVSGSVVQINYRSTQIFHKSRFEQLSLENVSYLEKKEKPKDQDFEFSNNENLNLHIYNTDVLIGEPSEFSENNIFGEQISGSINLKEVFQKEHNISTVVIPSTSPKKEWFITEILQSSGIPVILFTKEINNLKEKKPREGLLALAEKPETRTVGKTLLTKKSGNYSKEKFEFHIQKALNLEHVALYEQAIEEINLANASKEFDRLDSDSLKSDFIDARLKAKLYKTGNKFFFFEQILEKYKENSEYSLTILENLLRFCYTYYDEKECDKFYTQYYKLALSSAVKLKLRKNSFSKMKYYRYLTTGKYKKIEEDFFSKLEPSEFEDSFLFYKDLVFLLKKHFLLENADYFGLKLLSHAKTKEEKRIAEEVFRNNQILVHISGHGPKRDFQFSDDIYSSVLSKNWKTFDTRIEELREKGKEDVLEAYREKLYSIWKKLETGEDYDPGFLNPEKTVLGLSYFSLLDDKDRILVAYILSKSTANQISSEVNVLFDQLIDPKNGINTNLAGYILVSYIESLMTRPDIVGVEKYIKLFEDRFLAELKNPSLTDRYLFSKYKFLLFQGKNAPESESVSKHDYYPFYKKALNSSAKDSLSILKELLVTKAKEKFNSKNKRELFDFIYFLQRKAFNEENEQAFMDLVYYKDRIGSINERFFDRSFLMSEIGEPIAYSKQIQNLLPKGQEYKMVANLGLETFVMTISQGKGITGDQIIDDNRIWRFKVYDYYRNVRESGSAILEKEELELNFRSMLGMEKNKITYLYLSGYWIKIPLELKDDDRFFFVQSPEYLIINKPIKKSNLLSGDFFIKKYTFPMTKEFKYLERLIDIELSGEGKNLSSKVNISFEPLVFKDLDQILFGNVPLSKTENYPKREGLWIVFNSGLFETSFYKDDLNYALFLMDKFHIGPAVFSLGSQIGHSSNLLFVKEFLRKTDYEITLQSRFVNALRKVRLEYPREGNWNGYRLYTNSFLLSE